MTHENWVNFICFTIRVGVTLCLIFTVAAFETYMYGRLVTLFTLAVAGVFVVEYLLRSKRSK